MKKMVWILPVIVLGLAAAILFFMFRFERQDMSAHADDNEVAEQDEDAPYWMREYTIVDGKEIHPAIGKMTSYSDYYQEEELRVYGDPNAPADQPRLELRFRKPSPTGEMVPYRLMGLVIKAWREDLEEDVYRTKPRTSQEIYGLGFRDHNDIDKSGAKAVRVLISDELEKEDFRGLYMGRKYYMIAQHAGRRDPTIDVIGSFLLQVPENVPPGKVAVMEIDVTQKFDPYPDERETVSLHIKGEFPEEAYGVLSTSDKRQVRIRIGPDGKGQAKIDELGGELTVLVPRELGSTGAYIMELLYHKNPVNSNKVVFPDDADIINDTNERVTFHLRVPSERLDDETAYMAFALYMKRDSLFPLSISYAGPPDKIPSVKENLPNSVEMSFVPGKYYVGYITETDWEIIGRIRIRPEDEGRTLRIQPLDE